MWSLGRGLLFPVTLLLVWEIASRSSAVQLEFLSRPSEIFAAGVEALENGSILLATWQTFEAALFGLVLATLAGVGIGAILGLSPRAERTAGPTIEALRPIPAVAFIPVTLLLFGFGLPMEGLVVAYACIWPVLIATVAAVRGIEQRLLEVARALEMSFAETMLKIILPAALGRINVGIRVAAGFALVVAVTVEIVVNPRGLGYSLILAQQSLRVDLMYAHLAWLGILGYLINVLLRSVRTADPSLQRRALA